MSDVSDEANLAYEMYRLLTKTFFLLDDFDNHFFTQYGLSMRQFWAIQHLDEQQGISMVELSRKLLTDKSNVTSIVDRLEQRQLCKRTASPQDRRVLLITLTSEGREVRDSITDLHKASIYTLMKVVSPPELHSLRDQLQRISTSIESNLSLLAEHR